MLHATHHLCKELSIFAGQSSGEVTAAVAAGTDMLEPSLTMNVSECAWVCRTHISVQAISDLIFLLPRVTGSLVPVLFVVLSRSRELVVVFFPSCQIARVSILDGLEKTRWPYYSLSL